MRSVGAAVSLAAGKHPLYAGTTGTVIATAIAAVTFHTLYGGRAEALEQARANSANLASVVARELIRTGARCNSSLLTMAYGAQEASTWALPVGMRDHVLFDQASTLDDLSGAYVLDSSGHVKASYGAAIGATVSLADRDYFIAHLSGTTVGMYISRPYRLRQSEQTPLVGMTRRINAPDGFFSGAAVLTVRLEVFQCMVDAIDTGPSGSAYIMFDDGSVLVRKYAGTPGVAVTSPPVSIPARMAGSSNSSYVAVSSANGDERLYAFSRMQGEPLYVVVSASQDDVLADWRRRMIIAGALTAASWVVVVVSWALAVALREKVLMQAELVRLSSTDALTGLGNRRTLDTRLDQEWRRAQRKNLVLSVLFIDVDNFKAFNDLYGHARGDEALAGVARCIASAVRRASDVAARYGGEEFAVVLPDTSASDAARLAEKIRAKVQDMRAVHTRSTHGTVTVSIGCATGRPAQGVDVSWLLEQADKQLYIAKSAGRNQVKSIDEYERS
jgi:diguanylate cyclase (GGDEF)-like protein